MIFVNSMSDLFHELVPFEFVDRVFASIEEAGRHTFQILTKRPERMLEYVLTSRRPVLPNVWLGTSIENSRFTWRANVLAQIPAAVRFISAEPLLASLFDNRSHRACRGSRTASLAADLASDPCKQRTKLALGHPLARSVSANGS